ncbi:hypothetical protein FOZ63_020747 [Perkinsus olseni]|uniref:Carrier domain-containing protein n=1 Tax=Perkinsus olseni TaxID=32597 RepID=A0A7J6Q9F3_PEROL|nr:hypothetical protein FOZ63_020747 [Perkinsus olseni]
MIHLLYDNLWLNFAATVVKYPENIALRCNSTVLTYHHLRFLVDARASALSRESALRPGSRVLLLLERGAAFIVSALALWKLGCTMIPLDAELTPIGRARQVAEEADCDLLIVTTAEAAAELKSTAREVIGIEDLAGLESLGPTVDDELPLQCDGLPAPAYIMFTSGSSGRPKGVVVSHANVINVLEHFSEELDSDWGRLLAVTTFQFDISVLEYMLPLVTGRECIIADSKICRSGPKLLTMLVEESVDVMQATPTMWQLLIAAGLLKRAEELSPRLQILCGGEPFPATLRSLCEISPMVLNCYGPTETTIWSSTQRVLPDGDGPVPIGRPIRKTRFEISDSGELHIGGAGVALGYFQRTAAPSRPLDGFSGDGWYATGDRVRVDDDGNYIYLGRLNDSQVKVRGYRIELGEVEKALSQQLDDPCRCAVVPHKSHLAAFITGDSPWLDVPKLRRKLGKVLPPYMIPTWFTALQALPVTANGKLDRKALTAYPVTEARKSKASNGGARERIRECVNLVLGFAVVDDASLASQGVTSLLAVILVETLSEALGVVVDVEHVFAHARAASFLDYVEELAATKTATAAMAVKNRVKKKSKKLDPFMSACQDGSVLHLYSPEEIREKGVSLTDRFGSSPFHYAAGAGQLDVCKALLAVGGDPLYCDNKSGRNALHWAARNGRVGMIDWLLDDCGLPVDSETKDGTTPLQLACWGGFPAMCDVLVARGADVHHVNKWGCIVTHFAALSGQLETVKWCSTVLEPEDLARGNDQGHTAFHKAAYGGHKDICEWLLTFDVFKRLRTTADVRGQTPAILARKGGHDELAKFLDECT